MHSEKIRASALASDQIACRIDLAQYTSVVFRDVGVELQVMGHFSGDNRKLGLSPFGHGDDATIAVSMLLRIGSQLVSGSADLFSSDRHYAGAALIRQLVEVEYLAWAFEADHQEAARWLRSTRGERRQFFTPAKLRAAAGNHFRSVDYGHHCELGGHPVPGSWSLLNGDKAVAQLMLSDCLGHSGRIWNHVVGWARGHPHGGPVFSRTQEVSERFRNWKKFDRLVDLPPSPPFEGG